MASAAAARVASASEFPYIAYVAEPDTAVRSGPSRQNYETALLPAGYAVEVYRHDGNGWCAVRPPEGSFSLAPVNQLQILDQQTARVVGQGVLARVGSATGDHHSAAQVMLDRGETVALVEPPSPTSPWVRIAPPAGEFRWIAARRLSRTPPTESTPLAPASGGWQSPGAGPSAALAVGRISVPEPSDDPRLIVGDPFAHLRQPDPTAAVAAAPSAASGAAWEPNAERSPGVAFPAAYADDVQVIPGSPAAIKQAGFENPLPAALSAPPLATATEAPAATPTAGQPRIRFAGHSQAPLDPRVAEMQLRLSQAVLAAPADWQFAGVREEAAALLAQEQSPECREQLRDLLDRIATFETIQARYRSAGTSGIAAAPGAVASADGASGQGAAPAAAANNEVLARIRSDLGRDSAITPTPGATPAATAVPATEALYDAVGTLKPVVSRRANAPQYALIDDHGDVVTFVTATPDVNLQAYVGQRIGVRGSRGFMPEFRRAHVTASRVTTLEQTLVK
ncbi:MAG TPA: SH3 domain-containing protein [Lacipirellulaceae bacterium]|nr:SH3 domain-containing protein [Lacipirellulaceae bacterium]